MSQQSEFQEEPYQEESQFFGTETIGRSPPNSVEAEQSVLGAVFLENESMNVLIEHLQPRDFYQRQHQLVFESMIILFEKSEPIDVLTLSTELRRTNTLDQAGGAEYLSAIIDLAPTSANTFYYAKVIKEKAIRRRLIHEASEIARDASKNHGDIDAFIDSVEQRIFAVSDARVHSSFSRVSELVKGSIKEVERLYTRKDPFTGIPTGFTDLDTLTSGFQSSDLIIVAGRPSMGKTSLALCMAKFMALEAKLPIAIFSLEMSKEQITSRLLCSEARVSLSRVRSGALDESDFPRLVEAASRLAQADVYIDDTAAISVLEMRAKARRLHREKPLGAIFVDYLQLMRGSSRRVERRDQEISEISGGLKALAKELKVPVIALSQLNRSVETRNDKRPMMSDLRESGAIEQDADIIGFVYRDEVYNQDTQDKGVAEFIVSKHRNGATDTIRMGFQREFTLFTNLAEGGAYDYLGDDLKLTGEQLI
jgi:replicative DNA helicase